MDTIRWQRISLALGQLGHEVDMVLNRPSGTDELAPNVRYVSSGELRWHDYDVVKTEFHRGFDYLESLDGSDHPFIISKLGSVVGDKDETPGVYFYGEQREMLFAIQQRVAAKARHVAILTRESIDLWESLHGESDKVCLVPTGVDEYLPPPTSSPYKPGERVAVYIGNLYSKDSQREINELWQTRLNAIGKKLQKHDIRLYVIGPGDGSLLDTENLEFLGAVNNRDVYNYMYHASVGLVLAQGEVQHNESSKLYEYLRCGLPVVSETPVPNNHILTRSNGGKIAPYRQDSAIAAMIEELMDSGTDRSTAAEYLLEEHSWYQRARIIDELIRKG